MVATVKEAQYNKILDSLYYYKNFSKPDFRTVLLMKIVEWRFESTQWLVF